ncbi:MAG: pyridoxal-phosphate dependent enzyme [Gammaproteobacteria bacterium]
MQACILHGLYPHEVARHMPELEPMTRHLHIETPTVRAPRLNRRLGRELYFKMECYQPSGSFKLRGVGHLMADCVQRGIRDFVCSSGGNAGLAVAYSAAEFGVNATVILPSTTPSSVQVIAVETHGTGSFAAAVAAGRPVRIPRIEGLAKCLGALQVSDAAYGWTSRHDIRSTLVSDPDALRSCFTYLDELRVLVEPACGAGLAAVETMDSATADFRRILVIACGGAAVDSSNLAEWAEFARPAPSVQAEVQIASKQSTRR